MGLLKETIFYTGGAIIFLIENHFFKMSMGFGSGTNNFVEL